MKILFILGARSEWGYIKPVYLEAKRRGHLPSIWSCNSASLPEYGDVAATAKEEGFEVRQIVQTSFDGYTNVAMAKSVGSVVHSLTDFLSNEDYDWVVISGDRAEQLGATVASSYLYVPTAHIQAGERSGNIDGLARHAIARLSHLHFASNEDAANRLIRSGEESWRVVTSGAPQLDGLRESATEISRLKENRLVPNSGYILAVLHPETGLAPEEINLVSSLTRFLNEYPKPVVWIAPNNDAGSSFVRDAIQEGLRADDYFFENLSRPDFAGILANADLMVGNSSAGIIEAPTFNRVAINIGRRQDSRFRGSNVIDVTDPETAWEDVFRRAIELAKEITLMDDRPYGNGASSSLIVDALEAFHTEPGLLTKQITF